MLNNKKKNWNAVSQKLNQLAGHPFDQWNGNLVMFSVVQWSAGEQDT